MLTETWLSFRPCSTRGAERARPSFMIRPVGMLATTTMDSWTRLRSTLRICHARGVVRAQREVTLVLNVLHRVWLSHAPACEPRWQLWAHTGLCVRPDRGCGGVSQHALCWRTAWCCCTSAAWFAGPRTGACTHANARARANTEARTQARTLGLDSRAFRSAPGLLFLRRLCRTGRAGDKPTTKHEKTLKSAPTHAVDRQHRGLPFRGLPARRVQRLYIQPEPPSRERELGTYS